MIDLSPLDAHKREKSFSLSIKIRRLSSRRSMVSPEVYGKVADSVRATGVPPRGTQLDCWWYPVQTGGAAPGSKHPDWCVSDWVLPEEFYPNGTGAELETSPFLFQRLLSFGEQ